MVPPLRRMSASAALEFEAMTARKITQTARPRWTWGIAFERGKLFELEEMLNGPVLILEIWGMGGSTCVAGFQRCALSRKRPSRRLGGELNVASHAANFYNRLWATWSEGGKDDLAGR